METLLGNPYLLIDHIHKRLLKQVTDERFCTSDRRDNTDAAVLFLLGLHNPVRSNPPEPCLIFTERSRDVRQPGDLCFPGGGTSPHLDRFLAGLLKLPGFPLFRRPPADGQRPVSKATRRGIPSLLATSLRESFEEIRLNPLRITFLGPMAPEPFMLFDRTIYPMVAWTRGQKRFVLNREVERVAYIPLRHFLNRAAYGRFRLPAPVSDQPCVTYQNRGKRDLLWGVTYRIVMRFLDIVFNFRPPDMAMLPVVPKRQGEKRQ